MTQTNNYEIEIGVHDLPDTYLRDIKQVFPSLQHQSSPHIKVITICQKTMNDMSNRNREVLEERDALLQNFISVSMVLSQAISDSTGQWVDFIDPSSALPFYENSNSQLLETDELYTQLGFSMRELGCCRVIAHKQYGTHVFVGSLFCIGDSTTQLQSLLQSL